MKPIISIITITYNNLIGLEKTFKSVINQTYQDYEFVIIDGNSQDGTKAFLEKNQSKIDHWLSEADDGVYHAMNKGIRAANGKYVIFMNAGDCFYSDRVLEKSLPYLNNNLSIYYGDAEAVKPNYSRIKKFPDKLNFSFLYRGGLQHQTAFIKKELFEKYFYYDESKKITSDWEFFIYCICKMNETYQKIPEIICTYEAHGLSTSANAGEISQKERNITLEKHFPTFLDDYQNLKETSSKRYLQILRIKKSSFLWRILKTFISFLLIFAPKKTS